MPAFGDDKGEITETVVKLNRPELVRIIVKNTWLTYVESQSYHAKCKKPLVKAVLREELEREIAEHAQYTDGDPKIFLDAGGIDLS